MHFHRKSWIIKDYNSLISQFFLNFVVQCMLSLSLCSHATASILCQIIDKSYIRADLPFLKTSIICHSLWCIVVVDYWRFLWIRLNPMLTLSMDQVESHVDAFFRSVWIPFWFMACLIKVIGPLITHTLLWIKVMPATGSFFNTFSSLQSCSSKHECVVHLT